MVSEDEVHSFPSFSEIVISVVFCMAANDHTNSFGICFLLSEDKGTYITESQIAKYSFLSIYKFF